MGYGGMANSADEGDRLASILGNRTTMMMGNHGVLVAAETVGEGFDTMYYLERHARRWCSPIRPAGRSM